MFSRMTIGLTAIVVLAALALAWLAGGTFDWLCREDGVVENAQAALYAASALMFTLAARGSRLRASWMIGLAALSFWVAGEEISWGQRVLGVSTPDWMADRNVQHELNLHNMDGIHQHVRAAGLLFFGVLAFAFPLGYRQVSWIRSLADRLELPLFPPAAAVTVAASIGFQLAPRLGGAVVFGLDEIGELLLAMAFAAFALSCRLRGAPGHARGHVGRTALRPG